MNAQQKSLINYSNEILEYLLKFKEKNPDFTFSLRQRDSAQSKDVRRLEVGQWFQGSHYIYVPLFNKGDNARKIKTVGFQLLFDKQGNITNNFIEISFKAGIVSKEEIQFHEKLADYIGLELNDKNHGILNYENTDDLWKNLNSYITEFRDYSLQLLNELHIAEKYIIKESDFQKRLNKIEKIKLKLLQPNMGEKKINDFQSISEELSIPLNQIFYGPPGTGKTYTTIEEAIYILNPNFDLELEREVVKAEFNRLVDNGQIVFSTFHQSMSYEDFVEGIKPLRPNPNDSFLQYDIQDGLFKKICRDAKGEELESNFEEIYTTFISDIIDNDTFELKTPVQKKPFLVKINSNKSCVAIPRTETATEMIITKDMLKDFVLKGKIRDWKPYTTAIGDYFRANYSVNVKKSNNYDKKYVIIIDEINRGNVSQIFGELITLIEEDKRLGKEESIEVTLPYSKEKFGVPSNLYIIGTMNTADKSIEALDTALRRRFSFTEVMPEPELLDEISFDGFTLDEVLETINQRIEILLDRDHTIGHSYFLKVNSNDTKELTVVFQNCIIPLLQEYFYHDYEKIALILGQGFVKVKENKNIQFAFFDGLGQPEITKQFELITDIEDIEEAIILLLNKNEY